MKKLFYLLLLVLTACQQQPKGQEAETKSIKDWTIEDLKGKKVGALTGSVQDLYATKNFLESEVVRFDVTSDLIVALQSGKIDAMLYEETCYNDMKMQCPGLEKTDKVIFSYPIAAAITPSKKELCQDFNAFLSESEKDGTLDLLRVYFLKNDPKAKITPMSVPSTGNVLRVGVIGANQPWSSLKNEEWVGLDIEMMKYYCSSRHLKMDIKPYNFSGILSALQSGLVDIAVCAICDTPERRQNMLLSDPYAESPTVILAINQTKAETQVSKGLWDTIYDGIYSTLVVENRYKLILGGYEMTIIITLFATLLGTLLSFGVCYLRMNRRRWLSSIGSGYISIIRGLPVLVLLMILYYVVLAPFDMPGVTVAVIAFGINLAAYVSEMLRSGIESIDRGQTEAGLALGFSRAQTFFYIVLPQAVKRVMPMYKGEIISLLKSTSIVGYIAVVDITKASDLIRSQTFDAFPPLIIVALIYMASAWILGTLLNQLIRK